MQHRTSKKQIKCSPFVFAAILSALVAGSGAAPADAQSQIRVKPRLRVARGAGPLPLRTAVEPSIAWDPVNEEFVCVFSVQQVPTGGELEDPWYLDYATGEFLDRGGLVGWTVRWHETLGVQLPSPNGDEATDGSVTYIASFSGGANRFTATGVVDPILNPEGFTANSTGLNTFALGAHFTDLEVRFTRIGNLPKPFQGGDFVYIGARSEDLNFERQLFFRPSADGGVAWNTPWLQVPGQPPDDWAFGYPSRPVIDNVFPPSLHIAYADLLGEHIRATIANDIDASPTDPQFIDNNLDINRLLLENPPGNET